MVCSVKTNRKKLYKNYFQVYFICIIFSSYFNLVLCLPWNRSYTWPEDDLNFIFTLWDESGCWVLWFGFICMYKCFCSVAKLCPTLCGLMDCCTPGFSVLHYLPEFAQTRVHWVSDAFQPSHALMPPSPPAVHLSQIRVFSNVLALQIRWLKNWSFSISPSNEYSGLIFFRIDCFDLLALQGILKGLFHHCNLNTTVLWRSAFLKVQLSYPYMTTGKVMSLLFNTLSRFVITFLPRSKTFNFVAIVTILSDFGTQENKISYYFHFFSIYLPWSDVTRCHDLSFLNVEF